MERVEAELRLQKDLARHLRAGHPWVFRKAIEKAPKGLAAGAIVDVTDDGRFVARGYFDPHSAITVRILTREPAEAIDAAFWRRRVARAVGAPARARARDDRLPARPRRGGRAPGRRRGPLRPVRGREALLRGARRPTAPRSSRRCARRPPGCTASTGATRSRATTTRRRAGAPAGRVLWGAEPPERIEIDEHGMKVLVDVRRGQKTGHFLDQRENRRMVRDLARGRPEALNLFSYTGGFSVAAALGGSRHVVSVDLDADALALARENFRANGLDPADHAFATEDAFELLAPLKREGRRFDLVVCDPPAFAKSQQAVDAAVAGYASLNRAALAVLAPGGLLVTASCSARVPAEQFADAVKEAAFKARIDLQLVAETRQPPDHPVSLQFKEGRYLKCLVLRRVA